MTVLAFGNRISGPAWAREIAKINLRMQTDIRPRVADAEQVEIDLSSARSADFLVLGRLLALIRALYESGTKILVRMPSKDLLAAEQEYLDGNYAFPGEEKEALEVQISRHQRQRINCLLFMEQSGFEAALRTGPFPPDAVKIDREGASRSQQTIGEAAAVGPDLHDIPPQTPQRRRGIIPYRWIDLSSPSGNLADVTDQLLRLIKGLGLALDDAEAVAQGILAELIENARDHAYRGSPADAWVLIGGELTQPQSYFRRLDDFDLELQNLVNWAYKEPSPLLRLFVGDSGMGIPLKERDSSPMVSGKSILEAFNRHASHAAANRETLGLWKATRVVRSFQGSLLVTSGSATAGHIHEPSRSNPDVNIPLPVWLPGTIVESTILTAVKSTTPTLPGHAIRPDEEEAAFPADPLSPSASPLSCVTVTLRPKLGLDFSDKSLIQHELDESLGTHNGGLVILVEVPSGTGPAAESDIEDVISSVLDIVGESAVPRAVTLVFPGVSRRLLELAIDSLTGNQDSEPQFGHPSPRHPVLVVSPENTHYWVGGELVIRRILSILSQSAETRLRLVDVINSLDGGRDRTLERYIRDQPQLLQLDTGVIVLKLRPRDALDALTAHFSKKVSDAMRAAEAPGVKKGYYLTTSLRVATRWINSRDLLQYLHLNQIAGLLLANAVANGSRPVTRSAKPRVICVGSVDDQTASTFCHALSGVPYSLDSIAARNLAGESVTENPEQPVVVCTDVISRGAYVRKTVRELWDMGFMQVTVATLIDGRDLTYANESPEFLMVRGLEVPLVSLGFASLDPDLDELKGSPRKPNPIDPVTGTPLPIIYPHAHSIGKQQLYLEAIKNSGAARLGHIHRTGQKHFSAYVSPSTLFDYKPWEQHALEKIVQKVELDSESISSPGESHIVVVIYPSEVKDDFARVAYSLTDAIRKTGINCLDPVVVPRSLAGGEWAFPRFVQLPSKATHIVAVDSTSKTGRTLRELIRVAAVPGIEFISCFGLIHGMNDLAAMSLQQVRQVAAYSMEHPTARVQQPVPVEVRYLVRTAVSGEDSGKCPICRLRRMYISLPSALPESMSEYRLRLAELLALRSKDSVFEELATDLFGVHLSQQDCIDFLDWRSALEEARFSTANRADVVMRIRSLALGIANGKTDEVTSRERDALIRLIAAEHSRLDQAPMWFTSVRAMLVRITRSLLEAPNSRASDPMLRIQALVVLARADRHLFCEEYAEIIRMCRDHETVLTHALLEALALLAEDRGHASWRASLTEQIAVLVHELENERPVTSAWAFRPAEELTYLAAFATHARRVLPNSKQQAWMELRKFCDSVKRHKYDQALWRLQRRLESSHGELPASSRANAFKDWQQCRAAIEESILPNLAILRDVFWSEKALERRLPSIDDRRLWRRIVDGGGPEELEKITVAMGRVFIGSEPFSATQEERKDLACVIERWGDFFFQSPSTSENPVGTSILTDIIEQCPADLLGGLRDVFRSSDWSLSLDRIEEEEAILVFCSSTALLDAITHVQMNAEATHRTAGQTPRFQIQVSAPGPSEVVIDLLNSGSSGTGKGGGYGLRMIAESLAAFDCRLEERGENLPPGITYGVRLIFERWRWS